MPAIASPDVAQIDTRTAIQAAAAPRIEQVGTAAHLSADKQYIVQAAAERARARNGRESFQLLASGQGIVHEDWRNTVEVYGYNDFDESGNRMPGSGEKGRVAIALEHTQVMDELIRVGFDSLSADSLPGGMTREDKQNLIRSPIRKILRSNPTLFTALQEGGRIPDEVVDSLVRDPDVLSHLSAILNEAYDPSRIPNTADSALMQAKTDLLQRQEDLSALQERRNLLQQSPDKKSAFDSDPYRSPRGFNGTKGSVLSEIGVSLTSHEDLGVRSFKNNLDYRAQLRSRLEANPHDTHLHAELAKVEGWIADAKNVSGAGEQCQEFEELYRERTEIDTLLSQRHTTAEVDQQIAAKQREVDRARNMYKTKLSEKTPSSSEFFRTVEQAVETAVLQTIQERAQDFTENFGSYRREAVDVTLSALQERIDSHIRNRWMRETTNRLTGKKGKTIDREKAKADVDLLLEQGPDTLVQTILGDIEPPLTAQERALLGKDPDYLKNQRDVLPIKVLTNLVASGGKLIEAQELALRDSAWGNAAMERLRSDPNIQRYLKHMKQSNKWAIRKLAEKVGAKKGTLLFLIALALFLGWKVVGI